MPVRNQGIQGTCYAQSAACMKEWQEKHNYDNNEYFSPQFFYNLRSNKYDDDQNNDAFFGSIKFVVKLGKFDSNSYKLEQSKKTRNYLEYTDVSDKLYQPVKRENKIRVVKISKSGVKVGGF